jgi:RNA polymerase sigma-70 factor (ECF subfamily)
MTAPDDTIRTLWQRARSGDADARDRLFAAHADRASLFIRARLGPGLREHVDSQDVLQEAYLAAHRDFERFEYREEGAFGRWLFRIIENRLRDLGDRHGAAKRRPAELPPREPPTGPATAAERNDRQAQLLRALDALPEDQRAVLIHRYFEGLDAEETGRLLGRSAGAVRKLTARALVAFGKVLT